MTEEDRIIFMMTEVERAMFVALGGSLPRLAGPAAEVRWHRPAAFPGAVMTRIERSRAGKPQRRDERVGRATRAGLLATRHPHPHPHPHPHAAERKNADPLRADSFDSWTDSASDEREVLSER